MITLGNNQRTDNLVWMTESSAAFKLCQQAICNCQELYFLEDTATPILQTDAPDYGIGVYLYMVISFFSKSLVGAPLNWSTTEKECYRTYSIIVTSY